MKILKLDISGFRSLKDVSWSPGDLNVVIGPNGTGKSNLLKLLELISVSAHGGLGKYVQSLGGIEPLLWDGAADKIRYSVKTSPIEKARNIEKDSLTYTLELVRLGKGSAFRIGYELLANYYRVEQGKFMDPFKLLERQGLSASVFDEKEHAFVAPKESILEEETLLSLTSGPFTANHHIPPFCAQLKGICVFHDVNVTQDSVIRQPSLTRSETRVEPDGHNLISVLHTLYTGDRDFKKEINSAMKAAFGDDFEELVFPPAADQRIQLRVRWRTLKKEQSAADLSDGTLRFLFLLTVLASPSPAPVIAIDEPETGLHPSMLPIVAEYAVDAANRTQVILTTHSPQFLDAFHETRPTTTVTKWSAGETSLKVLDETELDYWLKEYTLGALFKSGELEGMG